MRVPGGRASPHGAQPERVMWGRPPVGSPPAGWTLYYSGVAHCERRRAGVGLLIAPQLGHRVLEFTPVNERVASLRLRVGERSLTVVCAYREPCHFGVSGKGTGKCSDWGLRRSTGGFQCPRGQWQWHLEGRDWEERPPWSEPEWCSVIGLLC